MIRAIITDFDGTLVDTFEANLLAYQHAFDEVGLSLSREAYKRCFGLRFDKFMEAEGVNDEPTRLRIRELKKACYPAHFGKLRPNEALIMLLRTFRVMGAKTAVASTARKENLMNALTHLGIADDFDLIFAGKDVKQGKPSPEIYNQAMAELGVSPQETLIFEDSEVGLQAAKASSAYFIKITL